MGDDTTLPLEVSTHKKTFSRLYSIKIELFYFKKQIRFLSHALGKYIYHRVL